MNTPLTNISGKRTKFESIMTCEGPSVAGALGQIASLVGLARQEVEDTQQLVGTGPSPRFWHAMQLRHQQDVLQHRQIGVDIGFFGNYADEASGC
jgi:hypothetical protein